MSAPPMSETNEPPRIAGPVAHPRRPAEMPVAGKKLFSNLKLE